MFRTSHGTNYRWKGTLYEQIALLFFLKMREALLVTANKYKCGQMVNTESFPSLRLDINISIIKIRSSHGKRMELVMSCILLTHYTHKSNCPIQLSKTTSFEGGNG